MKLAHIHRPKCAGVFVNSYFKVKVADPLGWRIQNSWLEIKRDWTDEELKERLADPNPNHFVTNHSKNWGADLVRFARSQGFLTFSFARHPGDLLCSYFFFHMKEWKFVGNDYPKLGIPVKDFCQWPLDAWLRHALDDPECKCEIHQSGRRLRDMFAQDGWFDWETPPWVDELDVYMPFTMQNFMWFLREHCNMGYHEWSKKNRSTNAGWREYVEQGVVTEKTVHLVETSAEMARWNALTDRYPLT